MKHIQMLAIIIVIIALAIFLLYPEENVSHDDCHCSSWSEVSCGGGKCTPDETLYQRNCSPDNCSYESKCVYDEECEASVMCDSDADCDDYDDCTLDVCDNPGTFESNCTNNPYCLETENSCGCMDCIDCSDNYGAENGYGNCSEAQILVWYCDGSICKHSCVTEIGGIAVWAN